MAWKNSNGHWERTDEESSTPTQLTNPGFSERIDTRPPAVTRDNAGRPLLDNGKIDWDKFAEEKAGK